MKKVKNVFEVDVFGRSEKKERGLPNGAHMPESSTIRQIIVKYRKNLPQWR
jgi:hypothetical protein